MRKSPGLSLGQFVDEARQTAGLSVRQLAEAADVPKTVVGRLLRDEVEQPVPLYLVRLAAALEVRASDLFLMAGMPLPEELPSVEALLRTEYDLPESVIREAKAQIDAIVGRYQSTKKPNNPRGGKK
jgi:transcriptional regulator with XRE-family HTH domain